MSYSGCAHDVKLVGKNIKVVNKKSHLDSGKEETKFLFMSHHYTTRQKSERSGRVINTPAPYLEDSGFKSWSRNRLNLMPR